MNSVSNNTVMELRDDLLIGRGASRRCYVHPQDPKKCIKVYIQSSRNEPDCNEYELNVYLLLKKKLKGFIVEYDEQLMPTSQGPGLVCELLRDEDGRISESLRDYIKRNAVHPGLKRQLDDFFKLLFEEDLYFYDFNLNNFVIHKSNGCEFLKYTDIKGCWRSKSWIKVESVLPFMARWKMRRRIKKFYRNAGLA